MQISVSRRVKFQFDKADCMKKIIIVYCFFVMLLSLIACKASEDKVVTSLGKFETRKFYTSGDFQDYTDYAKYYFDSANVMENKYLNKIQETDFAIINTHLDDFEGWIETIKNSVPSNEVVVNYDFDRTIIDSEDYFYIESEKQTWNDGHTSLVKYNIYLLDSQTLILYYFHNNI